MKMLVPLTSSAQLLSLTKPYHLRIFVRNSLNNWVSARWGSKSVPSDQAPNQGLVTETSFMPEVLLPQSSSAQGHVLMCLSNFSRVNRFPIFAFLIIIEWFLSTCLWWIVSCLWSVILDPRFLHWNLIWSIHSMGLQKSSGYWSESWATWFCRLFMSKTFSEFSFTFRFGYKNRQWSRLEFSKNPARLDGLSYIEIRIRNLTWSNMIFLKRTGSVQALRTWGFTSGWFTGIHFYNGNSTSWTSAFGRGFSLRFASAASTQIYSSVFGVVLFVIS